MSTYSYIAGIASAYGMALKAGYTGSYADWCELLASLEDFQSISATATTLAEGSSATASYANGVLSLGIPVGDTGNGIASIVKTATSGLTDTYTVTYTDGTTTTFTVTNGDDGYSPSASVSKSGTVTTITITDESGTTTAAVYDGTGSLTDVTVNGTSVVSGTVAAITVPEDASDITYDNTSSGMSATDVQDAIDELDSDKQDALTIGTGLSLSGTTLSLDADASDVDYDNTSSGLSATDVQDAIDELASDKQDALTFDSTPTSASTNPVTSGGVYTALSAKQDTISSISVTLAVASWSSSSITVTATGVTASNTVIVSPDPSSIDDYVAAGIVCTTQAADALTFTCDTTPTSAITVNVVIID